jgi:hypothetical protein
MLPAVAGLICTPHAVIPATARAKKVRIEKSRQQLTKDILK